MNAPRFRYSKCEPIPGDTGERFDCPENGYYNMTAAEMERADAEDAASRARDRREPATGEPGGEAARPEETNPWRQAVDAALVSAGLDCLAPDADPAGAIRRLLEWHETTVLDPAISERAQTLIERGQASAPQVALWQYREFHGENTVTPGWSGWKEVKPRNLHTDSVDDRVKELMSYIAAGYRYELRPLYAAPQASAPQVVEPERPLPTEIEQALITLDYVTDKALEGHSALKAVKDHLRAQASAPQVVEPDDADLRAIWLECRRLKGTTDGRRHAEAHALADWVMARVDALRKAKAQASAPSVQVVPPSANWRASQYGERWVVECHMPCINGLCAWVTVADLGQPEVEDEMFGGLDREGIAKRIAAALSATPVKASAQPAAPQPASLSEREQYDRIINEAWMAFPRDVRERFAGDDTEFHPLVAACKAVAAQPAAEPGAPSSKEQS